jgi:hypothetical protein
MGYAKQVSAKWDKSEIGKDGLKCVAVVEVVKAPGVPKTAHPYYVIKEHKYLTPRFFLFYSDNQNLKVTASSISQRLQDLVQ